MINKVKLNSRHIFLIIVIGFIVGGAWMIHYSSNMSEYVQGQIYNFYFRLEKAGFDSSTGNKIHIHNFVFYYDFTQNKGNISFHLDNQEWKITYIEIEFPSIIDNKTLIVYKLKDGNKSILSPRRRTYNTYSRYSKINRTVIQLENFEKNFSNETIVIEFQSNLLPNGRFYFYNYENNFLHHSSEFGNIHLVLGDKYECIGSCIYDLQYIEEISNSFDRDLRLKFRREKEENHPAHSFKINSIYRDVLFSRSFWLAIGVSLLVSSLMILLQEIKIYSQKRDAKDKFQEYSQGFLNVIKEKEGIGEKTLKKIHDALSKYKVKM